MSKRVVFTTPVQGMYDYYAISVRRLFRLRTVIKAFGLRFIRENIPEIEILEYPSWRQFKKRLAEGIDVLGVSFYMKDIPIVREMVRMAREAGVKEVWGGNYGVLTDGIEEIFDETFIGYAENEISMKLFNRPVTHIKHPLLKMHVNVRFFPLYVPYGILFTDRGCKFKCSFCQTHSFVGDPCHIPLDSIEDVIRRYKQAGVHYLVIMDENGFQDKDHTEAVFRLFEKYDIYWGICTRAENLRGRVAELKKRGFVISLIGVEAMRQSSLESVNKGTSVNKLIETINELHKNNVYVHTTYMIGYENDTEEQIREDIKALKKVPFDSNQTCILTPFPATKLYDRFIKKYDVKLDHPGNFDAYHLVWSHKNFTPESMDRLWRWAWKQLYSPYRLARSLYKLFRSGAIPHSWKPAVKEKNLPERTYPLVTEKSRPATAELSQVQVYDTAVEVPRNGNGKKPVEKKSPVV